MNARFQPASRPRVLATILDDLKDARRDVDDAIADGHDDRATEAETRLDDLRAEFDVKLAETTGLSVEELRKAYSEALI